MKREKTVPHIPSRPVSVAFCLAALLGIAACAPQTEETCDLESYRGFLGASLAAVTFPADPNLRLIMAGDIVTMDFVPDRVNIHVDDNGRIHDLTCG